MVASIKYLLVTFLLVTAFFGRGLCQDEEEGGGGDEGQEVEKTCQQSIAGLVLDALPIIPKCLFGPNVINLKLTNIFQALPRIYCVLKCVFAELTVFNEEGTLDEVAALLFFQEAIPEYALPPIVEIAQPCLALSENFKPSEYYCQSYSGFVQCLGGVVVRGIGPFALDCFGTPFFSGLFGVLNFFVPPAPPSPAGAESRRLVAGPVSINPAGNMFLNLNGNAWRNGNGRAKPAPGSASWSPSNRLYRLRERVKAKMVQYNSINDPTEKFVAYSIIKGGNNNTNVIRTNTTNPLKVNNTKKPRPTITTATTKSPASKATRAGAGAGSGRGVKNKPTNNNGSNNNRNNNNNFGASFNFSPYGLFQANNTNTIVYHLDRLTSLAKSLEVLTFNRTKFF